LLIKIFDFNTRCKRITKGVYAYEQQDEDDRSSWGEIAWIYGSKELAVANGWEETFIKKEFDEIVDICDKLNANETITISEFGKNRDLELHIYKDCDYNREIDKDYANIVTIHTKQNGKIVDDTEDTYVTDGELWKELERIWEYKDFKLVS
jgi:hypothetical protein